MNTEKIDPISDEVLRRKPELESIFLRITHKMGANEIQSLGTKDEVSFLNSKSNTNSSISISHVVTRDSGLRELKKYKSKYRT